MDSADFDITLVSAGVESVALDQIKSLRVTIGGDEVLVQQIPAAQPFIDKNLPRILYHPLPSSKLLYVIVEPLTSIDYLISGKSDHIISAYQNRWSLIGQPHLKLYLSNYGPKLTPSHANLAMGQQRQFDAQFEPCNCIDDWKILESSGGTIAPVGAGLSATYTAPMKKGIYHVIFAYGGISAATATVSVN